jgi:hypothetical protein
MLIAHIERTDLVDMRDDLREVSKRAFLQSAHVRQSVI